MKNRKTQQKNIAKGKHIRIGKENSADPKRRGYLYYNKRQKEGKGVATGGERARRPPSVDLIFL